MLSRCGFIFNVAVISAVSQCISDHALLALLLTWLQAQKIISLIFDQPFLEPYTEKLAPIRAAVEANPLLLGSPLLLLLPLLLSLVGRKKKASVVTATVTNCVVMIRSLPMVAVLCSFPSVAECNYGDLGFRWMLLARQRRKISLQQMTSQLRRMA